MYSYVLLTPQQCHFDQLLVNLQVEAAFIKDSMKIEWNAEVCRVLGREKEE